MAKPHGIRPPCGFLNPYLQILDLDMRNIINSNYEDKQDFFSEIEEAEAELCHPQGRRGFFAHLIKGPTGTRQRSHRIDRLPVVIDRADPALDNYISQAEFIKPNRRVVNLLRMNLSFIDLDIYHVKGSIWHGFVATPEMACAILFFCDDEGIPLLGLCT